MTSFSLPPEIRSLPVEQRVALAESIWNSVAEDEAGFELTDAQKAELDRRLRRRSGSRNKGLSWEEVKKRILENR